MNVQFISMITFQCLALRIQWGSYPQSQSYSTQADRLEGSAVTSSWAAAASQLTLHE